MAALAVVLVAAAVLAYPPSRRRVAQRRTDLVLAAEARSTGTGKQRRRRRGLLRFLLLVLGLGCGVVALGPLGAVMVLAAPGAVLWWRHRRSTRELERRMRDTAAACLTMAADLAAGAPPTAALRSVARQWPDLLGAAAGRAEVGADVAAELRVAASAPGAGALRAVAGAWTLSEQTGARLSDTLTVVADTLRTEEGVRREAAASLAGAHVTARTLAVLPVLTLLVTTTSGAQPWTFLVGSPAGAICVVFGAGLIVAGLAWVEVVSRRATRARWA